MTNIEFPCPSLSVTSGWGVVIKVINRKFIISLKIFKLPGINQTKFIEMTTKQGSTKIVDFMAPKAMGSRARAWPYLSYCETALFLLKSSFLL